MTKTNDTLARACGRIPCRCGVNVKDCVRGCTLFECCGGYVREGHMSDCQGAQPYVVHGVCERRWYTGAP